MDTLVPTLHQTDALLMKMIGILGSDLVKGAVDQKFILEKMKSLTEKREAIIKCVAESERNIAQSADYLRSLVAELATGTSQIETEIAHWFDSQSSEVATIERSKHRYIKLEKWNTVI